MSKKKPLKYDPDLFREFFAPITGKSRIMPKKGQKLNYSINDGFIEIKDSWDGAGRPREIPDDELIPYILKCIEKETINGGHDAGYKDFKFVTKQGKVQPTTISQYLEIVTGRYSNRQLVRDVKRILDQGDVPGVEKRETGYFKK